MYGELIPIGMGPPMPLEKKNVLLGRGSHCDLVVLHRTVSNEHCRLILNNGYWYVRDLNSSNGTRVNNVKVTERRVDPGNMIALAKQRFELRYSPLDLGAVGPPPEDDIPESIFDHSLMEKAGLSGIGRKKRDPGASDTQIG